MARSEERQSSAMALRYAAAPKQNASAMAHGTLKRGLGIMRGFLRHGK